MKSLQVLIIATSHKSQDDISGTTGVWLSELAGPYYIFKDGGECITISTPVGGIVPIDPKSEEKAAITDSTKRFKTDEQAMYHLSHSLPFAELKADNYDLVFIAGGHGSMVDMFNNKLLSVLLETFRSENKPIGAVGSGVVALLAMKTGDGSSFVKGKKITAYSNAEVQLERFSDDMSWLLETQLLSQGAIYSSSPDNASHVVVHGKLVTGQNPASADDTAKDLLSIARNLTNESRSIYGDSILANSSVF